MEYTVPSLHIDVFIGMSETGSIEEMLSQLPQLKEDWFIVGIQ